jgi:threonine/homoserine/homoserine lactone efflux protein
MSPELYLAYVAASLIVLLVPGPTVLLIIAHAMKEGRRATLPTISGVVMGDALAVTVSLAGLGAALAASAALFTLLKWAGALYLVYLGLRTLLARPRPAGATAAPERSSRRLLGRAFIVTALNPKSIAFFIAFLPQFLDPAHPLTPQLVLLGASFPVLAGCTGTGYALLASRVATRLTQPSWQAATRWTSGAVLIGAGIMTAAIRRA